MAREFELKYRASTSQMTAIMEEYRGFREISMETTYYDAPDRSLSARKWTLRRRLENGVSVCALKIPGENNACGEWETECGDILEAIDALCKLGAPAELEELTRSGVDQICGARFIRQAALIELENCTVELTLDRGFLRGGARIEILREAEVELKSGSEADAAAFAGSLAARYGLIPEHRSKFKRALTLAEQR